MQGRLSKFKGYWKDPDHRPWLFFALMVLVAVAFRFMFPFHVEIPWFFSTLGWLIVTIAGIIMGFAQLFIDKSREDGNAELITQGLYSYSRNPMYMTFMLAMIGLGLGTGEGWFIIIAAASGPIFNDFVLPGEEAHLSRQFGPAWKHYKKNTPKWL